MEDIECKLKSMNELHSEVIANLKNFSSLSIDLNLCFGLISHITLLDTLKEDFKESYMDHNLDNREGDYNMISELLQHKLNSTPQLPIHEEVQKCTMMLRYALQCMIKGKQKSSYNALIIDSIWKIMIMNIEMLIEREMKVIKNEDKKTKEHSVVAREKIKEAVNRLSIREKEIELEYTIKKEELEAKIQELINDKAKLSDILEANEMKIDELMDTSRFFHIHYFLSEFQDNFAFSYEGAMDRFETTRNILYQLIKENNLEKELNDDLSTAERRFPKYIITILRKLQEQLRIKPAELKSTLKKVTKRMKDMVDGSFHALKSINVEVQTKRTEVILIKL